MLILTLMFFGQIWSQHLKLSKIIEVSYRGILLYAYYDFNVYFFKNFSVMPFRLICSDNLKFYKMTT